MRAPARVLALGLAAGLAASPALAQDLVIPRTEPSYNCCLAEASPTRATGQTFVVPMPAYNVLTGFSVWVGSTWDPTTQFRAFLYQWSGQPVGPELYASGIRAAGDGTSDGGFRHDFATGGIALDPALTYVAFVSGTAGQTYFVHMNSVYAGGEMYGRGSGGTWFSQADYDMQFSARFTSSGSTVPEPGSVLLLATGIAGLAAVRRRRSPRA